MLALQNSAHIQPLVPLEPLGLDVPPLQSKQEKLCFDRACISGALYGTGQVSGRLLAVGRNQPTHRAHLVCFGGTTQRTVQVCRTVLDEQLCDVQLTEAGAQAQRAVEIDVFPRGRDDDARDFVDVATHGSAVKVAGLEEAEAERRDECEDEHVCVGLSDTFLVFIFIWLARGAFFRMNVIEIWFIEIWFIG